LLESPYLPAVSAVQIFNPELDDLIQLRDLSEFALLYKLKLRYNSGKIYTRVGAVLVAVNPYESLPIFSEDTTMQYVEHEGDARELDPHVFGLASIAYRLLLESGTNQAFLVSGESGAGKTETTKLVLKVSRNS
jgi:myosin heavy subunit